MPKDKTDLVSLTDEFFMDILKRVRTIGNGVDINTQIDFVKELSKWTAVRNKIAPDQAEGSKLNEYRSALKAGGSSGRSRSSGAPAKLPEGSEAKSEEGKQASGKPRTQDENSGHVSGDIYGPSSESPSVSEPPRSLRAVIGGRSRPNMDEADE